MITDNYNSTGNLVRTPQLNMLVDFGRGNLRALTQCGLAATDIDVIAISHVHPDHVGDLLAFFHIYNIAFRRGTVTKPLTIIGPSGVTAWLEKLESLVYEVRPTNMAVYEQPSTPLLVGDITVGVSPMEHDIPDVAYHITHHKQTVVYTGDTGWNNNLLTLANGVDTLVIECSNEVEQITPHHLNPAQIGQIAAQAHVRQLVFTHYGATSRVPVIAAETRQHFSGIITPATELLTLTLQ
jgi:ribonuclease BN (tRNA processing enzyme)